MKKEKVSYINWKIFFLIIILIQTVVCLWMMKNKDYLFTDEVYSYGLANCESTPFLDPGYNPTLKQWTSREFFENYTKYDLSVPFSFNAAFENQAEDVHPPIYYCFLHLACAFFPNAVYSVVPGILLNYMILLLSDVCLFFLAKYFLKRTSVAMVVVAFFGLSSACFSNLILVRMYMLQTFQLLLFALYNCLMFGKWKKNGVPAYIGLLLIVAFGGLTHYYFYFFAAMFGFVICIALLYLKEYKNLILYALSLWGGVIFAILVFPATLKHIFGYRGEYATENIGGFEWDRIKVYFDFIDKYLFGKSATILVLFLLLLFAAHILQVFFKIEILRTNHAAVSVRISRKEKAERLNKEITITFENWLFLSMSLAAMFFAYVAIQGSSIQSNRYIYGLYPLLALLTIAIIDFTLKRKKLKRAVFVMVCTVIPALSVFGSGIEWAYQDYPGTDVILPISGNDIVIVCRDGQWINVLQGFPVYLEMDEIRCVYESEIDNINQFLQERSTTDDPVTVAFYSDAQYSDEERSNILNRIIDSTEYTTWEKVYDYQTKVYLLE